MVNKVYVNQTWLNNKVDRLNEWLIENANSSKRPLIIHNRNYYINKLTDLDSSNKNVIEI